MTIDTRAVLEKYESVRNGLTDMFPAEIELWDALAQEIAGREEAERKLILTYNLLEKAIAKGLEGQADVEALIACGYYPPKEEASRDH